MAWRKIVCPGGISSMPLEINNPFVEFLVNALSVFVGFLSALAANYVNQKRIRVEDRKQLLASLSNEIAAVCIELESARVDKVYLSKYITPAWDSARYTNHLYLLSGHHAFQELVRTYSLVKTLAAWESQSAELSLEDCDSRRALAVRKHVEELRAEAHEALNKMLELLNG